MEVATLAEQLHLSKAMVQALEEENYEVLPARVFVRGYYRNFARLVNVPEEVVLSEFEKRCPEGEDCSVPPAVAQGVRKEIRSSHGVVRLVTWLVVIALLTTFGLWWKSNLEKEAQVSGNGNDLVAVAAEKETPAATVAPAADHERENREGQPREQMPAVTALPEPRISAAVVEPAAGEGRAGVANADAPAVDGVPVTGDKEEKKTASRPAPRAESPRVVLRFKGDCWVDVRGANKSFKMVGKRKAGEEIELTGEFPYRMVLGNARNVTIMMNGKPYDLAPHTRGNVAKLTLKPAAD